MMKFLYDNSDLKKTKKNPSEKQFELEIICGTNGFYFWLTLFIL